MASSFGNATTRGEAIVPNTRASLVDLLFQVEVTTRRSFSLLERHFAAVTVASLRVCPLLSAGVYW